MDDQDNQPSGVDPAAVAVAVTLSHHGKQHVFQFDPEATVADLAARVEETLYIPTANQKFLVPRLGLLKAPFPDPDLRLAGNLDGGRKITLMGTSSAEIESLHQASEAASARAEQRAALARRRAPKAWSRTDAQKQHDEATYTFAAVRELPHLPRPERSREFLERLRRDPGIRAAMRKHRFSVGLLTEMDPLSYTQETHEGTTRILGLNHNRGQVIELRLRTDAYDAYDGYRDYRIIRRTLCHELAHNVHGPHDRNFWDLFHQIEREVDRGDWKRGGHAVGGPDAEYYEPLGSSEEVVYDHGGWTGGEFVLGGGGASASASSSAGDGALSRREVIAKATEERLKKLAGARDKQNEADREDGSSA